LKAASVPAAKSGRTISIPPGVILRTVRCLVRRIDGIRRCATLAAVARSQIIALRRARLDDVIQSQEFW
jgi:hypothetical protein